MIHADLRGKSHVSEDMLTSNCLGLMLLLPDRHLINFLGTAFSLQREPLALSQYDRIASFEFWPWLPGGGEPDVIAKLRNTQTKDTLTLVIEVKHGASKSGSAVPSEPEPHAAEDLEAHDNDKKTGDQLAKYLQAAIKHFQNLNVSFIYLTHHRSIPKEAIEESQRLADDSAPIYWLSWFHLYALVTELINVTSLPSAESRILESLRDYLKEKGYLVFQGWSSIPQAGPCMSVYRHRYTLSASGGIARPAVTPLSCFYRPHEEEP